MLVGLSLMGAPAALAVQTTEQTEQDQQAENAAQEQEPEEAQPQQESKSSYDDATMGGSTAVGAQLVADDRVKKSLVDFVRTGKPLRFQTSPQEQSRGRAQHQTLTRIIYADFFVVFLGSYRR